jgi:FkbM family methyltransferase
MLKRLIPARYHYVLSQIKNRAWGGFAQTHYSQFGEDIALLRLLPKKGIYVDVGAHHPKRYSNTYLLFKQGWSGVNIDPNPETIRLFKAARPFDHNICVGIAEEAGTLTYYKFSDPAVNTFDEKESKRWREKSWITYLGTESVEVKPLKEVLSTLDIESIDLLTIDAEGMDLSVLRSLDWERSAPRVVVVEADDFNPATPNENSSYQFLSQKGFVLKGICGPSLIFDRA